MRKESEQIGICIKPKPSNILSVRREPDQYAIVEMARPNLGPAPMKMIKQRVETAVFVTVHLS